MGFNSGFKGLKTTTCR